MSISESIKGEMTTKKIIIKRKWEIDWISCPCLT